MSNRYSRVQPSQFDPLSLQEIMTVPLAKQATHDNALKSIDELGLFDLNRLEADAEMTDGFINDYSKKLQSKADQILERGVDQSTVREMMKLKNERDNFLQNDAKKAEAAYNANKANIELAGKMLQSGKIDAQRYSEIVNYAKKQYKGVKEGPYQEYLGAENFNYVDQAIKLGNQVDKEKLMELYGLEQDQYGMLRYGSKSIESPNIRRNPDGTISYEDVVYDYTKQMLMSDPKLQAELNHIRTVNGEEAAQEYLNKIDEVARSVNMSKDVLKEKITQNFLQNPLLKDSDSTKKEKAPMGLILNNREFTPHELSGKGYKSLQSRYSELNSRKSELTKEEYQEYKQIETFKNKIDDKLKDDKKYKEYKSIEKDLQEYIGTQEAGFFDTFFSSLNDNSSATRFRETADGKYQMYYSDSNNNTIDKGDPISKNDYDRLQKYSELKEYVDNKTKETTLQFSGYQLTPYTSQQKTSLKLMNDAMENAFKANPENIKSMVNIESLFANNSMFNDINEDMKDTISQAIYNSDTGSMQLVSVIPKGFSQKPEYVLRIVPNKDFVSEINSDETIWDDKIEEGKPFDIRVSFNEVNNGIVNTINGHLENYVASSGEGIVDPTTGQVTNIGSQMQMEMKRNRILSNFNATKFSEIKGLDIENPDINKIPRELALELVDDLYEYGLNRGEQPNEEQVNNALKEYFKENKRFYAD